jgi:hypothetical protein
MKRLTAFTATLAIALPIMPITVRAQSVPVCYWQTASGRIVNLTSMCGEQQQAAPVAVTISPAQSARILSDAAVLYGDEYCTARGEHLTGAQAATRAGHVASVHTVEAGLTGDVFTAAWAQSAQAAARHSCPELQPTSRWN